MKKIALFDPSYSTLNMGDFIISNAASEELKFLTDKCFKVKASTHNPVLYPHQLIRKNKHNQYYRNADYKFLLGSNILKPNLIHLRNDWNINLFDCAPYKNLVLVGAGFDGDVIKANLYTKAVYKKILSKDYVHSVRDENAKKFLESLGYTAVNTGCPTMWKLTKKHCKKIPKKKTDSVVFTLTDYRKDKTSDKILIETLRENYNNIYFWIQGSQDLEYLQSLCDTKDIKLIAPDFDSYKEFLDNTDCDYVGTRLHAGIQAMRQFKRSIILIVDNRARDIKETYNIPTIEREDISKLLEKTIRSDFSTNINIDEGIVNTWKSQFKAED